MHCNHDLPATSKRTLRLAIVNLELEAKHWYSPTSSLYFRVCTGFMSSAPSDSIFTLSSTVITFPFFTHVKFVAGGEPSTSHCNLTASFLRATVLLGSLTKSRRLKALEA